MTYREIVERLQTVRDDIARLHVRSQSRDGLEPEDQQRWDDLNTEFHDLLMRKRELERQADMLAVEQADINARVRERAAATSGGGGSGGARLERGADEMDRDPLGEVDSIEDVRSHIRNPWNTNEIRLGMSPSAHASELRARAMSAIEQMPGTTERRRETMTEILERFETVDGKLSNQLLATSSPAYMRAFAKLARTNGKSEVLNPEERAAVERAMSLADAAGGYLVPFQLDPTVILTSDGSTNEVRQISRKVVATGDVWYGVSAGAVSWSFDAEATEVSDDSPTFGQPSVTIRTARGFVPISLEAYQDENNVTAEVGRLLAQGKDDLENVVFINGLAANNEPVGIVTALAAVPASVKQVATLGTFALADLYAIHDALPSRYRRRAAWLANALVYSLTRQFDTAGGSALWAQLGQGVPQTLLGRPVYEAEPMDSTITGTGANNYMAIFGDFDAYVIADRIGMTVEFIPHLVGANHRPTGQRGWFAYYRVGANVVNPAAMRLLNVKGAP